MSVRGILAPLPPGLVTVSEVEPLLPLKATTIVACPAPTPMARPGFCWPPLWTVATLVFEDVQVAF